MKDKKQYLIIGLIALTIVGIILILVLNKDKIQGSNNPDKSMANLKEENRDLEQEEYLEKNNILINDVKYSFNGEKFILSFIIENKSSKKIDLRNYNINVLDKNKKVLATIGGTALGVIEANDKMASIIELTDNISTVHELEFVK